MVDAITFSLGPRRCPACGSHRVQRCHRRGLIGKLILRLILLRHYICRDCNTLYVGFVSRPRVARTHSEPNFENQR